MQPATIAAKKSFRTADDRKAFRNRLSRELLRMMQVHNIGTRDLAEICCVEPATVRQWIYENTEPGGFALTQLNNAFGREFRLAVAGVAILPVKAS